METIESGGYNVYGYDLGIIMLETKFPRMIGDIGNAKTWDFPVLYKTVPVTPDKAVFNLQADDIRPFIEAAKELEKAGVKSITTSCGFLSLFQKEMAQAVHIPVFTSALMMVSWIDPLINGKVGVLTANSQTLTKKHLEAAHISNIPVVIYGLQDEEVFTSFTVQNWHSVNTEKCREELISVSTKMIQENPDVKAIVLECTNMPPYTEDIKKATGRPVFDLVNMVKFIIRSL